MIDLHVHTVHSDGRRTATEMVETAAAKHLAAVAITDHDVLNGIQEAQEVGTRLGIDVVPGIEMTAGDGKRAVHILGYEIDPANRSLREALERGRQLMEAHVVTVLSEVERVAPGLTREHLDRYRTRYAGGAAIVLGLVGQSILRKLPRSEGLRLLRLAAEEPRAYSVAEAISLIHGAGGVASLAHPARLKKDEPLLTSDDLAPYAGLGVDALEAWQWIPGGWGYEHYQRVADDLGLLVTGGTDDHGKPTPESGWRLGSQNVPQEVLVRVRERAARYRPSTDQR